MSSEDVRLELLRRLNTLTEAQLDAARRLDGAAMTELNERRADVLFSLRVALQDPLPPDADLEDALAREARRLQRLEHRLAHLAHLVLQTLDRVVPNPHPPPTYASTGRMSA
jgi:hypothetical protein